MGVVRRAAGNAGGRGKDEPGPGPVCWAKVMEMVPLPVGSVKTKDVNQNSMNELGTAEPPSLSVHPLTSWIISIKDGLSMSCG